MKYYILSIAILLFSCKQNKHENVVQVDTMGTTGTIKYIGIQRDFQKEIDSLLIDVNMSLSTYIENSTISKFNNNEIDINEANKDSFFSKNFSMSKIVWSKTDHFFNPTILPLVNYWKVQNKEKSSFSLKVDSAHIDSLVILINSENIFTQNHQMKLDFSAIAKGFGVDVIAKFLEENNIYNYMVEIGGEVHCSGKNLKQQDWKIGIEEPNEKERNLYEVVNLQDKSMATSGNYRNFKVLDSGQKLVHIINPKTGYSEISKLLSASIIANDCMVADAYATACMVMGEEACFNFILSETELECYLIYSDNNGDLQTRISDGFKKYLAE